jgi:hypothetical protein
MRFAGRQLRSPASTSARRVCDVRKTLKRKYNLTNLQVYQLPVDRLKRTGENLRPDCLHWSSPSSRGPRCRPCSSARRARTGWGDASDGVCALRTDRYLYAAGVLQTDLASMPQMRESAILSLRSGRCRPVIRWKTSCCARPRIFGRRRRSPMRFAAPAGPCVFRASIVRFYRAGTTDIRPVGKTSILLPSLWCDGANLPQAVPDSGSSLWQSSTPLWSFFAERWLATALSFTGMIVPGSPSQSAFTGDCLAPAMCPFECQRRSVFKSGYLPQPS